VTRQRVWFDDYEVGDSMVSPSRRIYESDVLAYVRFSNDVRSVLRYDNPPGAALRVPDIYAFSLGICLLLHARDTYIPREFVAFYGFDSIRYHAPVMVGELITSTAQVTHLTTRGDNGVISLRHETADAVGACLLSSTQRMLVRRKPNASPKGSRL
jgi:hypothetical protein